MSVVAVDARPAAPGQAETAAFLSIDGLNKSFGGFRALIDIALTITEGEFVCFLGPSGCGKTTLLRVIAGLETQEQGRILQRGRDISGLPPAGRDLGIVFQSYALFPNLSVADNVAYGLNSRRVGRAKVTERVTELLALVGLSGSERKYPAQLSGGQQQRVALARALAPSPNLLLLDEPLSALDARVRLRLRQEIKGLQRRLGLTTIMVTHDQEEALTMADRIVVMDHGRIEQIGTPMEIYRNPATPFVANFVGAMNFLPGTALGPGRVRVGRTELLVGTSPADGPVTLCLRPEDVVARGVGPTTPNSLSGEIAEIEFLGSFCRARLTAADLGEADLIADFSINAVRDLGLDRGAIVRVALPADRLKLFEGVAKPAD